MYQTASQQVELSADISFSQPLQSELASLTQISAGRVRNSIQAISTHTQLHLRAEINKGLPSDSASRSVFLVVLL